MLQINLKLSGSLGRRMKALVWNCHGNYVFDHNTHLDKETNFEGIARYPKLFPTDNATKYLYLRGTVAMTEATHLQSYDVPSFFQLFREEFPLLFFSIFHSDIHPVAFCLCLCCDNQKSFQMFLSSICQNETGLFCSGVENNRKFSPASDLLVISFQIGSKTRLVLQMISLRHHLCDVQAEISAPSL